MTDTSLLEVDKLVTVFDPEAGPLRAVDAATVQIRPRETVGILGESGCGKSVTGLSIIRLLPERKARILSGVVRWRGENLLALESARIRKIRGKEIAMIFQDPMSSLNPVFKIGD